VWRCPTRLRVVVQLLLLSSVALAASAQESAHPLSKSQIVDLLLADVPSRRVSILAAQRGIDFEPSDENLETLRRAGADDDLLKAVRNAKRIFPEQLQLQALRAQAKQLADSGKYAEAEKQYGAALFLAPKVPELNWAMGGVQAKQKKWKLAVASYRQALEREPNNSEWRCDLGRALHNTGDLKGAIAAFRQAIRLAPDDPVFHNNLGYALEESGDFKGAMEEYKTASGLAPGDAAIRANLDRIAQRMKPPSLVK